MGRLTPFFKNRLTESNLILSEKETVSNSRIDEVYKNVYRYVIQTGNSIGTFWIEVYDLTPEILNEPEFILVHYENGKGWLYGAIWIDSYVMISFTQIGADVLVTVDMYRTGIGQRVSPFHYKAITSEDASLTWVDFIFDVFNAAGVDDYEGWVSMLLPDEVLKKRVEVADRYKRSTLILVRDLTAIIFVLSVILYFFKGL